MDKNETDLKKIGDKTFLQIASDNTKNLYTSIVKDVINTTGPVIRHFPIEDSEEYRVVIGYRQNSTARYNSALGDLANYYKLHVTRKYVEQFANGVTIISMYVTSKLRKSLLTCPSTKLLRKLLYCTVFLTISSMTDSFKVNYLCKNLFMHNPVLFL